MELPSLFSWTPGKMKVNANYYVKHLKKALLPTCSTLQEHSPYYSIQDGAPSHTANITQESLWNSIGRRFIKKDEWPPNSPDCSPLHYVFCNAVKSKFYEGMTERFENTDQLKKKHVKCGRNPLIFLLYGKLSPSFVYDWKQ